MIDTLIRLAIVIIAYSIVAIIAAVIIAFWSTWRARKQPRKAQSDED